MSYENALRNKYRYPSVRGELTTEQLWDLPLQSTRANTPDLDSVAKEINRQLKEQTEESFVETKSNPLKTELEGKLEIVKHVIATKQAENAAARTAAERRQERERLQQLLALKDQQELEGLSKEEIQRRLDALS